MIKTFIKVLTFLFVLLPLCFPFLYSQTDDAYVGMAQGKDSSAVRESAFQNLAQQIQVFISSKSYRETSEGSKAFKDSLFSRTVTQSFMSLTNVQESVEKIDSFEFIFKKRTT